MKIGIVGCAGRMGLTLVQQVLDTPGGELGGGVAPAGALVGRDLGSLVGAPNTGVKVTSDASALFAACDCVIDFTAASAATHHAHLAAEHGTALVLGTTGLNDAARAALRSRRKPRRLSRRPI